MRPSFTARPRSGFTLTDEKNGNYEVTFEVSGISRADAHVVRSPDYQEQ